MQPQSGFSDLAGLSGASTGTRWASDAGVGPDTTAVCTEPLLRRLPLPSSQPGTVATRAAPARLAEALKAASSRPMGSQQSSLNRWSHSSATCGRARPLSAPDGILSFFVLVSLLWIKINALARPKCKPNRVFNSVTFVMLNSAELVLKWQLVTWYG
jgi:hypothetical protein